MSDVTTALDDAKALLGKKGTRIAVVGASNDPSKYGNIIVKDLVRRGYEVLPVNPKEPSIAGLPAFKALGDVPKPVDIVDVVTPPPVTRAILKEAAAAGLPLVWLQDGSFDDTVLSETRSAPFKTVHHACIMVEARRVGGPKD